MHAAIAILAALLRRARDGRGRVPRRLGRRRRALADVARDRRAPRDRRRARPRPRHPHRPLRLLRRLPLPRRTWLAVGAIEPAFCANLCRALGSSAWIAHQNDDAAQDADPRRPRAPPSRRATATSGSRSSRPPTPAWRRSTRSPSWSRDPHFAARGAFVEAQHPSTAASASSAPRARRRAARREPARAARGAAETDTDALLARRRLLAPRIVAALRERRSDRVSQETTASAVGPARRGAGLDRPEALRAGGRVRRRARLRLHELRLGRERQPALLGREGRAARSPAARSRRRRMISVWFRPHHWAPGPQRAPRSRSRCTST